MVRSLLPAILLLALSACGKEEAKAPPEPDAGGGPQIATSIDDYALPVDKSDQVTAIDAATGDAAGMPRDGGAVVRMEKPEAKPAVEDSAENAAAPAAPVTTPPLIVPPPPAGSQPAQPSLGK